MTTMANKLGVDTGSFVNYMYGNYKPVDPKPGMGCTVLMWTDRYAGTIHKVSEDGKKVWYSEDEAKRIDKNGMSESQTYEFSNADQNEPQFWSLATLRKDGRWHQGISIKNPVVLIGKREHYYDYSF